MVEWLGALALLLAAPNGPPELQRSCDAGRAADCLELGRRYQYGHGVPTDAARAATLYDKACTGNDAEACMMLGLLYSLGTGVAKDEARADTLYQKACDGGSATGCAVLAHNYTQGEGVAKDPARAVTLDQRACDLEPRQCSSVALRYKLGEGVPTNLERAAALFKRACDGGAADGCRFLANMHANGEGVAEDAAQALALYQKACDARDDGACDRLGQAYATGGGVARDPARAAALFQKGCEMGGIAPCDHLGRLYASGEGVARDPARAAALFKKSCDGGYPFACHDMESLAGERSVPAAATVPKFDGRGWRVDRRDEDPSTAFTSYVLPGQTSDNATENLSCRLMKDAQHQVPLQGFLDVYKKLTSQCPGTVWTVIQHDETTAVVEMYTMLCNGVEPQSTVARFSVADEGIYAVAYSASRKGAFPAARRKAWMDILSRVTGREACAPRP